MTSSAGHCSKVVVGMIFHPLPVVTGSLVFHSRWTSLSATLPNTSAGPVRSSWVTPGNSSNPKRNGDFRFFRSEVWDSLILPLQDYLVSACEGDLVPEFPVASWSASCTKNPLDLGPLSPKVLGVTDLESFCSRDLPASSSHPPSS